MAELVHSIREVGLLQPVVVRRTGPDAYELVMGERRWRATQAAGLDDDPGDHPRDRRHRHAARRAAGEPAPLPAQPARGGRRPTSSCSRTSRCTHEELACRIGRSRPQISNTLRLLKLSPAVQRRVAAGVLSAGHARSLLAVEDPELQDRLAQRVVAEGISVRGLEEIVAVGETGARSGGSRGTATPPDGARAVRARRPALRPARDPGQGRPRSAQGQDHRRVRLARRPAPDRRHHGPAEPESTSRSSALSTRGLVPLST